MTKNAVIYSRFSTDLQNEKSIAHQEDLAHDFARRNGYEVIGTYADAAQSGASILGRDGLMRLINDSRDRQFQFVICESLDRLSRDMEDLAGIHKRLTFAGVQIVAVHEGIASTLTVGLRGIIGQLYREDNAHKIRRGLTGKVKEGLLASGKSYGYAMDTGNKGLPVIVPEEADIVRRIYQAYVDGHTPRKIAHDLNAEGIPGPRGNLWKPNTIYGWEKRGTGILRNPIYTGKIVWNRSHFIKDPDTGRRVSRLNPPEEWVINDVPEYRIVDQRLFDQAQALCAGKVRPFSGEMRNRPKRLLSGLLRCGACGGGMSTVGKDKSGRHRIECTRHRDTRTCPAPKTFYLDIVENLVIDALRRELHTPELLAEYIKTYNETRLELSRGLTKRRTSLEKQIADLDAYLNRLVDQMGMGIGDAERIGRQMKDKEAEYKALKAELVTEPEPIDVVALHPGTVARYEAAMNDLKSEIEAALQRTPKMAGHVRELIHSVTVLPNPEKRGGVSIVVQGNLRLLVEGGSEYLPHPDKVWGEMVAGARFELTTFRL